MNERKKKRKSLQTKEIGVCDRVSSVAVRAYNKLDINLLFKMGCFSLRQHESLVVTHKLEQNKVNCCLEVRDYVI